NQDNAEPRGTGHLTFGLFARAHGDRSRGTAASRELRQRLERGSRATVAVEKATKGARPDIFATDQPQPVQPLLVSEVHGCTLNDAAPASTLGRVASCLVLADPTFRARREAADIAAMHDPDEQGYKRKQNCLGAFAHKPEQGGRCRCGRECGG